jgi:tRNA-splicing ligase RtcB
VLRSVERLCRQDDVAALALMPDVHLAEDVCIGAVVGTRASIYPGAVGGDIGCGVVCIQLNGGPLSVGSSAARQIITGLRARVPADKQRSAVKCLELERLSLSTTSLDRVLAREGVLQLGTLGRGNHFLELQQDDQGSFWLMVHSGSRALGPAVRAHHAGGTQGGLTALTVGSSAARDYFSDHLVAVRYAELNRAAILAAAIQVVCDVLGSAPDHQTRVECPHNFVRQEVHSDERYWVHRKGAISAREGEPGIIPGSMGSESFLVVGRGAPASLCSSSHGAGRAMSRTEARQRISVRQLDQEMDSVWFDGSMARALREEAPSAYKPISQVMHAQRELTRIIRRLRPVLVYKGA